MLEQDSASTDSEATSTNLPKVIPSTGLVLHRTQTTLGLLRDIVQESSAEYWYERGQKAIEQEEWVEASYNFNQCMHWLKRRIKIPLVYTRWHLSFSLAKQNLWNDAFDAITDGKTKSLFHGTATLGCNNMINHNQWEFLYIGAKNLYENGLKNINILYYLAILNSSINNYSVARYYVNIILKDHVKEKETQIEWLNLSASLWEYQKDYFNALNDYNLAHKIDNQNITSLAGKGFTSARLGNYQHSYDSFLALIKIKPEWLIDLKTITSSNWSPFRLDSDFQKLIHRLEQNLL
jgi:tetratricopeptide (TPR) repeat protein